MHLSVNDHFRMAEFRCTFAFPCKKALHEVVIAAATAAAATRTEKSCHGSTEVSTNLDRAKNMRGDSEEPKSCRMENVAHYF